jgi:phosphate transport system permease protein
VAGGSAKIKHLHSRPTYYGALTAVWCGIPALVILGFWLAFESSIVTQPVIADLPAEMRNLPAGQLNLIVNDIRNLVSSNIVSGDISPAHKTPPIITAACKPPAMRPWQ